MPFIGVGILYDGARLSQAQRVRVREDGEVNSCAGLQPDVLRLGQPRSGQKRR